MEGITASRSAIKATVKPREKVVVGSVMRARAAGPPGPLPGIPAINGPALRECRLLAAKHPAKLTQERGMIPA